MILYIASPVDKIHPLTIQIMILDYVRYSSNLQINGQSFGSEFLFCPYHVCTFFEVNAGCDTRHFSVIQWHHRISVCKSRYENRQNITLPASVQARCTNTAGNTSLLLGTVTTSYVLVDCCFTICLVHKWILYTQFYTIFSPMEFRSYLRLSGQKIQSPSGNILQCLLYVRCILCIREDILKLETVTFATTSCFYPSEPRSVSWHLSCPYNGIRFGD